MFLYYLTSFVNGFMNSVNKMTNVKAGQCFGAAKGSLINYLEATFLSLALVFMTSDPSELAPAHVFSVPAWAYLGAICGLVAMVLIIVGTLHTHVLVSSIVALVGNLGMALVLDYVFYGLFSWQRVIGILLILLGITWIEPGRPISSHADMSDACALIAVTHGPIWRPPRKYSFSPAPRSLKKNTTPMASISTKYSTNARTSAFITKPTP